MIISCVGFSSIYSNTQGFHTLYETPPASALKSASASFAFNTNYETRNPLIYKDVEVTDIGFNTHSRHAKEQKNLNKKFVKFINEIMDKKLITSYNGFLMNHVLFITKFLFLTVLKILIYIHIFHLKGITLLRKKISKKYWIYLQNTNFINI